MSGFPISRAAGILLGVGLVLGVLSAFLLEPNDRLAFLGGYLLFALDVIAIAWLARLLVQSQQAGGATPSKGLGSFLGLMKFVFLALGLYILLVSLRLSGLYVAAGAFVALAITCFFAIIQHLRSRGFHGQK